MFYHKSWQDDICSFRAVIFTVTVSFKLILFLTFVTYRSSDINS